jgi:WD40 repeat protein
LYFGDFKGCIHQFNTSTGKISKTQSHAHEGVIRWLAITPDHKNLFTVGNHGHLKQWGLLRKTDENLPEFLSLVKDFGKVHTGDI